jgi:hypothetical protein
MTEAGERKGFLFLPGRLSHTDSESHPNSRKRRGPPDLPPPPLIFAGSQEFFFLKLQAVIFLMGDGTNVSEILQLVEIRSFYW